MSVPLSTSIISNQDTSVAFRAKSKDYAKNKIKIQLRTTTFFGDADGGEECKVVKKDVSGGKMKTSITPKFIGPINPSQPPPPSSEPPTAPAPPKTPPPTAMKPRILSGRVEKRPKTRPTTAPSLLSQLFELPDSRAKTPPSPLERQQSNLEAAMLSSPFKHSRKKVHPNDRLTRDGPYSCGCTTPDSCQRCTIIRLLDNFCDTVDDFAQSRTNSRPTKQNSNSD